MSLQYFILRAAISLQIILRLGDVTLTPSRRSCALTIFLLTASQPASISWANVFITLWRPLGNGGNPTLVHCLFGEWANVFPTRLGQRHGSIPIANAWPMLAQCNTNAIGTVSPLGQCRYYVMAAIGK